MDPPPTGTSRRFLLPKRATQLSQTQGAPAPASAAAPRFQSTPRFGSSSVPRPTQPKRDVEDVEDDVEDEEEDDGMGGSDDSDEVVEDSWKDPQNCPGKTQRELTIDSIEAASEARGASPSLSPWAGEAPRSDANHPQKHHFEPIELDPVCELPSSQPSPTAERPREAKRRRLSLSPASFPGSKGLERDDDDNEMDLLDEPADSGDDLLEEYEESDGASPSLRSYNHDRRAGGAGLAMTQPTFRAPPRFKTLEQDAGNEGLPAPFSPQRKGAKYLVGGLAAELQGLLSEIKGKGDVEQQEAEGEEDTSTFKLKVQSAIPGKRMSLVYGSVEATGGEARRVILAGRGNVEGLGRKVDVAAGSVVRIGQPLWDAEVEGNTWAVACNWSIEE